MYSDEMLRDILTAWLRIDSRTHQGAPWLAEWFLHPGCVDEESAQVARVVAGMEQESRSVFVERLNQTLEYAVQMDLPSHKLAYHLFCVVQGLASAEFQLFVLQLRDKHMSGRWNGHDLFVLSARVYALCVERRPMVSAQSSEGKPSPWRSVF